eukprot:Rhum_TRINITY_DN14524_c18_g1::Rhum_TRINITY_DN14524_c18_g1_i1::g.96734::m.96734
MPASPPPHLQLTHATGVREKVCGGGGGEASSVHRCFDVLKGREGEADSRNHLRQLRGQPSVEPHRRGGRDRVGNGRPGLVLEAGRRAVRAVELDDTTDDVQRVGEEGRDDAGGGGGHRRDDPQRRHPQHVREDGALRHGVVHCVVDSEVRRHRQQRRTEPPVERPRTARAQLGCERLRDARRRRLAGGDEGAGEVERVRRRARGRPCDGPVEQLRPERLGSLRLSAAQARVGAVVDAGEGDAVEDGGGVAAEHVHEAAALPDAAQLGAHAAGNGGLEVGGGGLAEDGEACQGGRHSLAEDAGEAAGNEALCAVIPVVRLALGLLPGRLARFAPHAPQVDVPRRLVEGERGSFLSGLRFLCYCSGWVGGCGCWVGREGGREGGR